MPRRVLVLATLASLAACRVTSALPAGDGATVTPARAQTGAQTVPPPGAQTVVPTAIDVDGFWTADELARMDEGLAVVNASRADLGFQKQPIDDPFRLDVVRRALDDPLSVGRTAAAWDTVARGGAIGGTGAALVAHARASLDAVLGRSPLDPPAPFEPPSGLHQDVADRVAFVLAMTTSNAAPEIRGALQATAPTPGEPAGPLHAGPAGGRESGSATAAERALLRKALLSQVEKPSAPIDAPDMDDAAFVATVRTVDRARLHAWSSESVASVETLVRALQSTPPTVAADVPLRFESPNGRVVIYGTGDDVHPADEDAVLVIDLGGNDTYLRGASANLLEGRSASVVIDLSGDDRYVGGNDFSFGGALGGIAIQWDCGGNDTYLAGHCSLGAGILGVGVLVDEGGDDVFRAKDFCEGAGAYGIGVLLKRGGNDLYHADLFGQGFASTWGCGVLADVGGNDTYDAGGAHLHAPLFRDRYQSLSQGFAIGNRPTQSGGVGVLVDVSGNDRYVADIYAQGSSYWYSLGLLIDDDGHDTYVAGQYSCGSGIHLSAGMLLDRAGNDSYHCLNGVGGGGAHDFAVGFLVDRGGDDHYSGSGGSQGGALTNSVAMLIDDAGDDGYCAVRGGSQGVATPARGSGGIGLLLDGGGKDVYSETTRNDGVWLADSVGAGIDTPSVSASSGEPQAAAITEEAAAAKVEKDGKTVLNDGSRVWDLDKLWALASEWEVNDNRVIVPIARARLWELGAPALGRAFERLGSASTGSGLEFRAVESTIVRFAADARDAVVARLLEKTRDADVAVRKGAVSLLGTLKATESVDRLVAMLATDEPCRRAVVGALGAMKQAPPAVAALLAGRGGPSAELEGVNAAVCLGAAGDDASMRALLGAVSETTPYLVRLAATDQLAALGGKAVPGLGALAMDETASATARRSALRALGRSKAPDAVDPILESLRSSDRWIRLSAMQAARSLAATANDVDRQELLVTLESARAMESDPLLLRLRP